MENNKVSPLTGVNPFYNNKKFNPAQEKPVQENETVEEKEDATKAE